MTTVLHVITGLGSGGAERMLTRVATQPGVIRHVVVSLMDEGLYGPKLRAAGVEVISLGLRAGRITPAAFWRLVSAMRRIRPDTVMTWLYHADLIGTIAALITGCRRIVWNLRCSDMDFTAYRSSTRIVVWLLALMSRIPNAVVVNSHAGRRAHEALGYRPRQWIYLPNGFDLEEWQPNPLDCASVRSEFGLTEDQIAFCAVARVDPQKDHGTLLNAFETLCAKDKSAQLVLIGRGTEDLDLPATLSGRVKALGERRDVARLLRGMDVLVLSSAYGEGFPNVVGEAMATALPCVVTDVGDAADLVGSSGIAVPPRAPAALAEAMSAMLGADRRRELGRQARERVAKNWSLDRVRSGYAAVFQGLD